MGCVAWEDVVSRGLDFRVSFIHKSVDIFDTQFVCFDLVRIHMYELFLKRREVLFFFFCTCL